NDSISACLILVNPSHNLMLSISPIHPRIAPPSGPRAPESRKNTASANRRLCWCNLMSSGARMAIDIGASSPDFTLPDQDRHPVRLHDELGRTHVILAFFPAAFSSVCTKELCSLRDQFGPLHHLSKAQVLAISVDT